MTQDPFAALGGGAGGGGLDMNALLQQAQAMQEQLVSAQAELAETTVTGSVAGGLVEVSVNGTGELTGVAIKSDAIDADDTESLGDLIVAAYRDAKSRADALASEKLGPMAGGLGI